MGFPEVLRCFLGAWLSRPLAEQLGFLYLPGGFNRIKQESFMVQRSLELWVA